MSIMPIGSKWHAQQGSLFGTSWVGGLGGGGGLIKTKARTLELSLKGGGLRELIRSRIV